MNIKTNPILKSLRGILAALTVALGLAPRPGPRPFPTNRMRPSNRFKSKEPTSW